MDADTFREITRFLTDKISDTDMASLAAIYSHSADQKRDSDIASASTTEGSLALDGKPAQRDENEAYIRSKLYAANQIDDGTHKKHAQARDLLLDLLEEHPSLLLERTDLGLLVLRGAAQRCNNIGPVDKSVLLFRKLTKLSNAAEDYFALSEILTRESSGLDESLEALEKAIELDPSTFGTPSNLETLKLGRAALKPGDNLRIRPKIGRYPQTTDFLGDINALIRKHIAADQNCEPKFLERKTRFFTMGSCFARNISKSLNDNGFVSHHMEISEYINTTFANKAFVNWLKGNIEDVLFIERIKELLPPGWDAARTLEIIRQSDVFVLTLGVAAAFFDRTTGSFVLPRPTALNSRVLSEKYISRTTTVQENVENVLYLINFVRAISPNIRIVLTVSPVPLLASFEFESCVQADCISKSTMRLTAHEILKNSGIEGITYWPSFEVFRWVGSNSSNYFAQDDGAAWHVSEDKVNDTIKAFIDMFSAPSISTTDT